MYRCRGDTGYTTALESWCNTQCQGNCCTVYLSHEVRRGSVIACTASSHTPAIPNTLAGCEGYIPTFGTNERQLHSQGGQTGTTGKLFRRSCGRFVYKNSVTDYRCIFICSRHILDNLYLLLIYLSVWQKYNFGGVAANGVDMNGCHASKRRGN